MEDDRLVAAELEALIESIGCRVAARVASGEQAIELTLQQRFDLVLMDIGLQGELDGIDAAKAIRERSLIPILYVTAHADAETLARAAATENCGYVLKPFSERRLRGAIAAALSLGSYARKSIPPHELSGPAVPALPAPPAS